ncbi:MAG: TonB-dependent receptor [Myxococcaceae bacterium]|nr:TonB-dependent receptor [Myxococcaceae bacterium]
MPTFDSVLRGLAALVLVHAAGARAADAGPQVLTKAPAVDTFVDADYPPALEEAGAGGEVLLMLDVDATGRVEAAEVTQSTQPDFAEPARAAALKLRFSPAEIDGAPAAIRLEFRYVFTPRPRPPPQPLDAGADARPAPVNLAGVIREAGLRRPLPGAAVLVDGEPVALTGDDGRFEVRGVRTGAVVKVELRAPAFEALSADEQLADGERLEVSYYLRRISADPFETVVRTTAPQREAAKVQLTRDDLSKVPGTSGDPIRVLQNLPGMARVPIGGELLVRGGNPSDSRVFIDGIPVPTLFHVGGLTSVVNRNFIDAIDFYPGGFGARYGAAISGVAEVKSRELDCDGVHGEADVNTFDASAYACVLLPGKVRVAAAARRSYADAFLGEVFKAMANDTSGMFSLVPAYFDYQVKIDAAIGNHRLSLFAFGADDTLAVTRSGSTEGINTGTRVHTGSHQLLLRHDWRVVPSLRVTTRVAPGLWVVDVGTTTDAGRGAAGGVGLDIWGAFLASEFTLSPLESFTLRGGVQAQLGAAQLKLKLALPNVVGGFPSPVRDPTRIVEYDDEMPSRSHSYWVEADWRPGFGLSVTPGLRVDRWDFNETRAVSVQPRLNTRWELFPGRTLKAAYGWYEKLPTEQQLLGRPLGEPELEPLQAHHFILGYEHQLTELVSAEVQGYVNLRRRLPADSRDSWVENGQAFLRTQGSTGGSETFGAELLLRHRSTPVKGELNSLRGVLQGRFHGWLAYTFSQTTQWDHAPGDTFSVRAGDGATTQVPYSAEETQRYRAPFDQTHSLTLVGQVVLPWGIEFGARYRVVSGNPFTAPREQNGFVDVDANVYRFDQSRVQRNGDRMPTFHQLDLRVEKAWTFDLWKLTTYLEVINVYNQQNVEQWAYDYRARTRAPVSLLPLYPVLGVKGAF